MRSVVIVGEFSTWLEDTVGSRHKRIVSARVQPNK